MTDETPKGSESLVERLIECQRFRYMPAAVRLVLNEAASALSSAEGGGSSARADRATRRPADGCDTHGSTSLETYPVEHLLDALSDAERDMENVSRQHRPTAPARYYCNGKATGFRAAWELVVRFRTVPVLSSEAQSPSQDGRGPVRAISAQDEPSSLSAEAQNVRLREVLELAYQAIGAWVCTYADDMVGEDALEAARSRIAAAGGTLAYTAEISEAIREVLAEPKDTSNEG